MKRLLLLCKVIFLKKKDLKGKTFFIRKGSSYYQTLLKQQKELGYSIKFVSEEKETEEILEDIESGKYELTLADSSIVNREISMGTKVKKLFPLKNGGSYSWIVRKNNPKLLDAVNKFFKLNYKGLKFNIIYNKYFKNIRRITKLKNFTSKQKGKISQFDNLFKKYAKKYNFNWLMIASQSFQESRFNPKAKSWVGAMGLMQVMPKTGKMLGFNDLYNPDNGVHAGTKYMKWLKKRFKDSVPAKDKLWFTLASYNAGYGHVLDAIEVAKIMGLNPNKWFNNVAVAMTKLSKRKYRKYTKYGYCKCKEPIAYVSQIKTRYETYSVFIKEKEKSK
jgi:membrane-bound lytic murein transglycosylase F